MPLVLADRVRETTTTTGTGTIFLAGPVSGFQGFNAAIGNGNTTYYTIVEAATGAWEVGIGTYTSAGSLLSRDTVLSSSNAGNLVNFSVGSKDVFVTQPAERSLLLNSGSTGLFAGNAAFTANGVPYANSTSTLTTGSALTFDGSSLGIGTSSPVGRLTLQGAAGTSGINQGIGFQYSNGTQFGAIGLNNSSGWLQIMGRANAGLTFHVNSDLVTTGEAMRLDSSGNLGIGVTPSAWVTTTTSRGMQFGRGGSIFYSTDVAQSSFGGNYYQDGATSYRYLTNGFALRYSQSDFDGGHYWYTAPSGTAGNTITFTQAMTLDASGNLGVGTTSPVGVLEASSATPVITASQNNTAVTADMLLGAFNAYSYDTSTNSKGGVGGVRVFAGGTYNTGFTPSYLAFYTHDNVANNNTLLGAATERARIDSSGNLGLGVTPSAWGTSSQKAIQVQPVLALSSRGAGNTDSAVTHNAYYDGTNWRYIDSSVGAARYQMTGANAGSTHSWSVAAGGTAGNAISFTQAMTLGASGNLGLGTTPSYKLHVAGASGAELRWENTDDINRGWRVKATTGVGVNFGTTSGIYPLLFDIDSVTKMTLDTSGNLSMAAASAITSSRINPRTSTTASTATLTPDIQAADQYNLTAQAVGLTVAAPIGTPVDGNKLMFRILDNGSAQTIAWNATYTAIGVTLPTATTANKMVYVGCVYNSTNTRWDVVAVTTQA